ncbi:hypothetical protein QBC41DRAFT_15574 [Cercophora samala]|uniref:Uncharacterized protein n=1 Tax=Cercophora samala TaxID=330535 RepID=A0AA39Z6W1_9PEZI|nr:hypothetical protein QBC41DRAFT_15574 [Cercophora samala]
MKQCGYRTFLQLFYPVAAFVLCLQVIRRLYLGAGARWSHGYLPVSLRFSHGQPPYSSFYPFYRGGPLSSQLVSFLFGTLLRFFFSPSSTLRE